MARSNVEKSGTLISGTLEIYNVDVAGYGERTASVGLHAIMFELSFSVPDGQYFWDVWVPDLPSQYDTVELPFCDPDEYEPGWECPDFSTAAREMAVSFEIIGTAATAWIDETRDFEAQYSDTGPTHSKETWMKDEWIVDPDEATTVTCKIGNDTWGWAEITVPSSYAGGPGAGVAVGMNEQWPELKTGESAPKLFDRVTIDGIEMDTSNLLDTYWDDLGGSGGGEDLMYMHPDGNTFEGYFDGGPGQGGYGDHPVGGFSIFPGVVPDWSNFGICDWGENQHNGKYDDVWCWGGFVKSPIWDVEWPDGYADGDAAPLKLGDIRSLGTYRKRVGPWASQGWNMECEIEPFPGASIWLRIDNTDLNKDAPPYIEHWEGQYIPIGMPDLSHTDRESQPDIECPIEVQEIDFDLGGPLGHRASAWEGQGGVSVTGGGVGTTGNFSIDVPAGGGTLVRNLIDPSEDRAQYYANGPAPYEFEVAARWHLANESPGGYTWPQWPSDWTDPEHDVYDWSWCRYLLFSCSDMNEFTDGQKVATLRVTYVTAEVTDNRMVMTDWSGSYNFSAAQTVAFDGYYGGGHLFFDLGLVDGSERPDLSHVQKVEIQFEDEATWEFTGVVLPPYPVSSDPRGQSNLPASTKQLITFHEVHRQYSSGGIQAVSDGLNDYTLNEPYQYGVWTGSKEVVKIINYRYSTSSVAPDQSAAWGLSQFISIIRQCKQGWECSLPGGWTDRTEDVDGNSIQTWAFDVHEQQDRDVTNQGMILRLTVRKIEMVPNLVYAPYGLLCVEGGLQNLQSERSASGDIQKRGGAASGWQFHETATSDAFGYWTSGGPVVFEYDDSGSPVYWQYGSGDSIIDRLYSRQWEWVTLTFGGVPNLDAEWSPVCRTIVVTDAGFSGIASAGHRLLVAKASGSTPRWSQRFDVPSSQDVRWVSHICTSARQELVEGASETRTRRAGALNGQWDDAQTIDSDYTCAFGKETKQGAFYMTGYKAGKQYLLRRQPDHGHSRLESPSGHGAPADEIEIGPSDEVPAAMCQIPASWEMLAAVQSGGDVYIYHSKDWGNSWSQNEIFEDLSYPYLACDRRATWLAGYRGGNVYAYNFEGTSPQLSLVGQADEGRSALAIHPYTGRLYIFAPKTTDWGAGGATPGIAEYESTDRGHNWSRREIHGVA